MSARPHFSKFHSLFPQVSAEPKYSQPADLSARISDLSRRLEQRTDLTSFDRSIVFNLGRAILSSDLEKLQAILKSYKHFAEPFARLAYILAAELICPEVSIFRVSILNWRSADACEEHRICVLTLRLPGSNRFIDIATEPDYGVNVFGQQVDCLPFKLIRLQENPREILSKIGTGPKRLPEHVTAAWFN
jgi:hypothetical protein